MINNYKYPYYYPQPQLLKDQYRYASQSLQLDLPLPGYSQKVPFVDKPVRFLNLHRKQRELDYLKSMIQHKVDMEQMHYQARIQQMRRQNQYNRLRLEQMLNQQPKNLFNVPEKITNQGKFLSENLENISLKRLQAQKQRYLMDSVDKVRMQNPSRNSKSMSLRDQEQLSHDSQKEAEQKKQRERDLGYIYKKNGAINTGNHFGTAPILKQQQKKIESKLKEKREQFQWVQKVKNVMKKKKFLIQDNQSVDSSKPSENSEQKKQKQKQKQAEKVKQKQASIKNNVKNIALSTRNRDLSVNQQKKSEFRQPQTLRQRTPTVRTVTRQEQISDMSQFSQYAEKNNLFDRRRQIQKENAKKRFQNIFERDDEEDSDRNVGPINNMRGKKGNWKV